MAQQGELESTRSSKLFCKIGKFNQNPDNICKELECAFTLKALFTLTLATYKITWKNSKTTTIVKTAVSIKTSEDSKSTEM